MPGYCWCVPIPYLLVTMEFQGCAAWGASQWTRAAPAGARAERGPSCRNPAPGGALSHVRDKRDLNLDHVAAWDTSVQGASGQAPCLSYLVQLCPAHVGDLKVNSFPPLRRVAGVETPGAVV